MPKLEHKVRNRKVLFLQSPLALLMLSACGGGGSSSQIPLFTKTGRVIKGPIENAIVGLDYDGDGVIDTSSVMTDASGYYSINASQK